MGMRQLSLMQGGSEGILVHSIPLGPPVFDAASSGVADGATSGTLSWSHTCTGSNRAIILGISYFSSGFSITSIKYAGVDLVSIGGQCAPTVFLCCEQYKLSNPASGANSLVITYTGTLTLVGGLVSYTNANQDTANLTGTQAIANGSTSPATVNVTSSVNEAVVDVAVMNDGVAVTVGGGQTQRWNALTAGSTIRNVGSTELGAASVTMSWTFSGTHEWAISGVSVKAP